MNPKNPENTHSGQVARKKISKTSDMWNFVFTLKIFGSNTFFPILASPFWDMATLTCLFWEPWKTKIIVQSLSPQIWRIWCCFCDQGSHLICRLSNNDKYGTPENQNLLFIKKLSQNSYISNNFDEKSSGNKYRCLYVKGIFVRSASRGHWWKSPSPIKNHLCYCKTFRQNCCWYNHFGIISW